MIYMKLFWSFFQIGLFTFGGGYAALPQIQNQVVEVHKWLTMKEFGDVITISQMTPGPIGINSATFVGIRIVGWQGAVVATIGCVLPSCIIVLSLAYLYKKYRQLPIVNGILSGLRPAVVAMILIAGIDLIVLSFWNGKNISVHSSDVDFIAVAVFIVAFFILRRWKFSPILVMLSCGVVGILLYSLKG